MRFTATRYKYINFRIVDNKGLSDKELKDEEDDLKDPNGETRKIIREHYEDLFMNKLNERGLLFWRAA